MARDGRENSSVISFEKRDGCQGGWTFRRGSWMNEAAGHWEFSRWARVEGIDARESRVYDRAVLLFGLFLFFGQFGCGKAAVIFSLGSLLGM